MADPSLSDLADRIDDVARLVTRQTAALGALADARSCGGPDVPLLVELFALRADALRCAGTARSRRERNAFDALAAGLERLLVGRGGAVVAPQVGDAFSGTRMEAAEVVASEDPARDRTVAAVLEPGLVAADRSIRPARVVVHRHRPS